MKDDTLHEALSGNREQMIAYEGRMKRIFDEASAIREAELRVEEGIKQEIEQGIEQGIGQGREEGRKDGELEEKMKTARRLLLKGMGIHDIIEVTELAEEQVLVTKKEMN